MRVRETGFQKYGAQVRRAVQDVPNTLSGTRVGNERDSAVAVPNQEAERGNDMIQRDRCDRQILKANGLLRPQCVQSQKR